MDAQVEQTNTEVSEESCSWTSMFDGDTMHYSHQRKDRMIGFAHVAQHQAGSMDSS